MKNIATAIALLAIALAPVIHAEEAVALTPPPEFVTNPEGIYVRCFDCGTIDTVATFGDVTKPKAQIVRVHLAGGPNYHTVTVENPAQALHVGEKVQIASNGDVRLLK